MRRIEIITMEIMHRLLGTLPPLPFRPSHLEPSMSTAQTYNDTRIEVITMEIMHGPEYSPSLTHRSLSP